MKKVRIIILILCLVSILTQAQVFTEMTDFAPAVSASGSANLATIDNIWSIWANPAGLSRLSTASVAVSFFKPYSQSFTQYQSAGIAYPLNAKLGSIALGYSSSQTTYGGMTLSDERALSLSHAFYLQKDITSTLAIGYSLNLYYLDYGKSAGVSGDGSDGMELGSAYSWGLNLGLQASLHERVWLGLFVRNLNNPTLGSALSAEPLPKTIDAGLGYEPYEGLTTNLVISQKIGDFPLQIRGGLEYGVTDWLKLRAGASNNPSRLACGFGITQWHFLFDYAFVSHPALPETHQFSIGYQFKARMP